MSVLLHVCRTCHHRETSHQGGDRGYSACPCCRGPGDIDPEPLLVPTWAFPRWEVEPLHRPGSQWNAGTTHRLELCACARCYARFAELVGEHSQDEHSQHRESPGPGPAATVDATAPVDTAPTVGAALTS